MVDVCAHVCVLLLCVVVWCCPCATTKVAPLALALTDGMFKFPRTYLKQDTGSGQETGAGSRQEQAVGRMPGQSGQPASTRFGEAQISFPLWRPHAATLERTQKKQTNQNMCIYIKKKRR